MAETFGLAREVRRLDMEAAPYDLAALGYKPVAVETPDGRAEYVRRQRELTDRARPLRARLGKALRRALATIDATPTRGAPATGARAAD